ncbi:MAG: FHA domain-containing protein [Pirellulaceae bacterium]
MQAVLINGNGPHEGRRRWIRQGEQLTVGASAWADVVIDSTQLLPIHLLIDLSQHGCVAYSVSGVEFEVNGQATSQACLANGDVLRVQDVMFRVELDGVPSTGDIRRVDLAGSVLPAAYRQQAVEDRLRCQTHDSQFMRFTPGNQRPLTAVELVTAAAKQSPFFGLCRFDQWRFPCPQELSKSTATIPKADSRQAIPYLPHLFPISHLENPIDWLCSGFANGSLMLLASDQSFDAVLQFLRSAQGLFLSPTAMKNVLSALQDGAMEAVLGPIHGIILGTNQDWVFYGKRDLYPDQNALQCDSGLHNLTIH